MQLARADRRRRAKRRRAGRWTEWSNGEIDSRRVASSVIVGASCWVSGCCPEAQGARCHQSAPIFNVGVDDVHGLLISPRHITLFSIPPSLQFSLYHTALFEINTAVPNFVPAATPQHSHRHIPNTATQHRPSCIAHTPCASRARRLPRRSRTHLHHHPRPRVVVCSAKPALVCRIHYTIAVSSSRRQD